MFEYYYDYLGNLPNGKLKQRAYYLIHQGLSDISASFSVPKLDCNELSEIFTFVCLDHPEIFYASSFSFSYSSQADSVEFTPKYLFRKKDISEHQKAISSRIQKLIRPMVEMDELGKEKYIHDFICQNVRYDKLKKEYSHEIIGPLTQSVGVCEGIAKTVKVLCDAVNLPCIIVFCHNNPDKKIKYRHAWNLVQLGKDYYHLDATFDNTLTAKKEIRYDYFNLDESSIFRDHEPLVWNAPECGSRSEFYYIKNKLSFTKLEDVRNRAAQSIRKNRQMTFHWRGGYLTKEVLNDICCLLEEEAKKKKKNPILSLNWPQAVFQVQFEDAVSSTEVKTEVSIDDANEGEKD